MLPVLIWLFPPLEGLQTCNYLHLRVVFGKERTSKLIVWGLEMAQRLSAGVGYISCLHYLKQLSAKCLSSGLFLPGSPETPLGNYSSLYLLFQNNTKAFGINLQKQEHYLAGIFYFLIKEKAKKYIPILKFNHLPKNLGQFSQTLFFPF